MELKIKEARDVRNQKQDGFGGESTNLGEVVA
jgi:hypothetical protein